MRGDYTKERLRREKKKYTEVRSERCISLLGQGCEVSVCSTSTCVCVYLVYQWALGTQWVYNDRTDANKM